MKISNDIYGLAFTALLDPSRFKKEPGAGHVPDIHLNKKEIEQLYAGALIVVMFQLTLVFLISKNMFESEFCVLALPSVWYFIPRFLSGLMMHLQVEPDIR